MNDICGKWDRQELYEKVWQYPLRKLAVEYGISDVALANVCRKLQIPLPGLGHWTKIQCGHKIPTPALPAAKDLPVLLRPDPREKTPLLTEDSPKLEIIQRIEASATPHVTNAMLAHPLVESAKRVLSNAQTIDRGVLWPGREVVCLDLRVSKACLPRALRIIAALVHMLEKEGFNIFAEKRESESTCATIYGQTIRFGVVERSRQVKPPTPPTAKTGVPTSYAYNSIKLEPTGRLSVEIWKYSTGGYQKTWRDRDSASLEDQLPKCAAGMIRIALWARAEEVRRVKAAEVKQKQIDEVTDVLQRIEEEEAKIKTLKKKAAAWWRAERIRNYIAAVRSDAAALPDSSHRKELLEWIGWAEGQADRIDPLKKTPTSIIDDKQQILRRLQSVRWGW
jgi:hypothetical protein